MMLTLIFTILLLGLGRPSMPSCPEDAAIVGSGDYANGYWTHYDCIAVDDLGGAR